MLAIRKTLAETLDVGGQRLRALDVADVADVANRPSGSSIGVASIPARNRCNDDSARAEGFLVLLQLAPLQP